MAQRIEQTPANCPTIAKNAAGEVRGLGAGQIGLYRNPASPELTNIYFDRVLIGPTRESVGG